MGCGNIQNRNEAHMKSLFIAQVRKVIFEINEPRTLKGLVVKFFFSDFSKQLQVVKSNYVKKLLVGDFAETTGFYNRFEKTRLLWSLTHNKLEVLLKLQLNHVECCRKVQNLPDMPWPPTIDEASDNNECINLLTKFLSWIKISSLKNQSCHHR